MLSPLTNDPANEPQVSHSFHKRKYRRRRYHFLAAWMRSPKGMGALLPSSKTLARTMVNEINLDVPGIIIELGAGTGVMTNALLQRGIPPERLLIIERDKRLHATLSAHFHGIKILCEDAVNLEAVLAEHGINQVCAIVSSLPFLTIPKPIGHAIQEQMARVIGKDGMIVQFTFGLQSPISRWQMEKYHLKSCRAKIVMINVPPAQVWVYKQA